MLTIGQTSSLVSDYFMIYENDPALDKEAEDFEALFKEYLENLDETKLPMKAGQPVTRFKLRHIRGNLAVPRIVARGIHRVSRQGAAGRTSSPRPAADAPAAARGECYCPLPPSIMYADV